MISQGQGSIYLVWASKVISTRAFHWENNLVKTSYNDI